MSGSSGVSWLSQLQPASWRGIPFSVRGSEYRRGRRFAVHEYPYKDLPWAEDVGRASRVVGFSGFVVGDDCYQHAQALLAASEQPGAGSLVHPSLGSLTVALIEPLVATERAELGRVVEIRFEFLETGQPIYPDDGTSTQADVADKAATTQAASGNGFTQTFRSDSAASASDQPAASQGGPSPNDVGGGGGGGTTYTDAKGQTTTLPPASSPPTYQSNVGGEVAAAWGDMAKTQAADPGLTAGAASGVAPPEGTAYGRFDGIGSLSFTAGGGTPAPATPQDAIDDQVQQRNQVDDAADAAARAAAIS